jgi:hypothetical protein
MINFSELGIVCTVAVRIAYFVCVTLEPPNTCQKSVFGNCVISSCVLVLDPQRLEAVVAVGVAVVLG